MTWTITTTTTISASRAVTLAERIPSEPIKFIVLHPGTGAGGTVTIWDDLGRSVASTRIDALSPRHEAEFFSDRSIFNVSAAIDGNAALSGAGVSVYLVSREAPEPSIADGSTSFAGSLKAAGDLEADSASIAGTVRVDGDLEANGASFAGPVRVGGDVVVAGALIAPLKTSGVASYVRHPNLLNQTTFAGYTWGVKMELPVKGLRAVRFALTQSNTGDSTYIGIVGLRSTLDTGWTYTKSTRAAWAGSASKTLIQAATPTRVWSDWMMVTNAPRTDVVGAGAVLQIRVYSAEANLKGSGGFGDETPWALNPLKYTTGFMSGDHVTDASVFTPTNPSWSPICAIEYATDDDVVSVMEVGDSICVGEKATLRGYAMLHIACDRINTKASRVTRISPMELSVSGRSARLYYPDFLSVISEFQPPQIAVFRPYTRNNGSPSDQSGLAITFVNECRRRGITPVLCTGIYESATVANNVIMQDTNASVRAIAAKHGVALMDLEPIITADNAATMLNADGIHPSQTGTLALTDVYETVLEPIAARFAGIA